MNNEINPFDILSGKCVKTDQGIFWFKVPGYNIDKNGSPIYKNLHRENDLPAAIWNDGDVWWFVDGYAVREPRNVMFSNLSIGDKFYFQQRTYIKCADDAAHYIVITDKIANFRQSGLVAKAK